MAMCKPSGGTKQGTSWSTHTEKIIIMDFKTLQNKGNAGTMLLIDVSDFEKAINSAVEKAMQASKEVERKDLPRYVKGLRGIRDLFGVSHATAQKYKNTWLAPAVTQQGRILLTDTEMALKLFAENNKGGF
jgi:hypothetical protein